jgi:anti-sigma regulatory factor (Ser/Thr protein kinase)
MPYKDFPSTTLAAIEVRSFVRQALGGPSWQCELVASELVANVIRHAQTVFRVEVEVTDRVTITVSDQSTDPVAIDDTMPQGGLGLRLVDRLSQRWGVRYATNGKSVWAELGLEVLGQY